MRENVYVPNKTWHKEDCLRNTLNTANEELIVLERGCLGYWSTYDRYECPECGAEVEVDN
jgi:hypothetical protein